MVALHAKRWAASFQAVTELALSSSDLPNNMTQGRQRAREKKLDSKAGKGFNQQLPSQ